VQTKPFQVQKFINELESKFKTDKARGLVIEKKEEWIKEQPAKKMPLSKNVLDHIPAGIVKLVNKKYSDAEPFDVRKDCFSHQVEALKLIFEGKNVAITTAAASGKSLCYQIAILSEMLKSKDSTALLIFPTNALSVDQVDSIVSFGHCKQEDETFYKMDLASKTVFAGEYSGATKGGREQGKIRKYARMIITNPDSIHAKILPYPRATQQVLAFKAPNEKEEDYSFKRFFKNLKYVVLDEIHVYRGVFGANVAYVMRRLRLLCEKLGNTKLQFICCSATINNPKEHAEKLIGLPFNTIKDDGAPKFRKDFLLWNPPRKSKGGNERREATTDALEIFERVIAKWKQPIQTISFLQSVKGTNSFDGKLRGMLERIRSPYKGKTIAFSRPLPTKNKREIQKSIKSGNIVFISATNALELGIDIGDLTCCILVGYPGNISSTLQRAGRVGRTGEAPVVLILNDEPLEQYFANHPNVFFKLLESPGDVKIPLGNKYLLFWHLKCALAENRAAKDIEGFKGYSEKDYRHYLGIDVGALLRELEKNGKLYKQNQVYWLAKGKWEENPKTLHLRSIRIPISDKEFQVIDKNSGEEKARIDYYRAGLFFHEGAVWLQNGEYLLVTKYSRSEARIEVETLSENPGYETHAIPRYNIKVIKERLKSRFNNISLHHGDVTNNRSINVFLKTPMKGRKKPEVGIITSVEPIEYDTTATWILFNDKFVEQIYDELRIKQGEDRGRLFEKGLHGLAYLLTSALPLLTECDKYDISFQTFVPHRDLGKPSLFLIDTFHGGIGLSKEVFESFPRLLDLCEDMIDMPEKLVTFFISEEKVKEIETQKKTPKLESLGEPVVVDKKLVKAIISHIRSEFA
jgi:DEAD/DEAH box helicase domain-containing protein